MTGATNQLSLLNVCEIVCTARNGIGKGGEGQTGREVWNVKMSIRDCRLKNGLNRHCHQSQSRLRMTFRHYSWRVDDDRLASTSATVRKAIWRPAMTMHCVLSSYPCLVPPYRKRMTWSQLDEEGMCASAFTSHPEVMDQLRVRRFSDLYMATDAMETRIG